MKKIFNIVAEFELTAQPGWLDNFRNKYDKAYRYHLTLKPQSWVDADDVEAIKGVLQDIARKYTPFEITFTELETYHTKNGYGIMIIGKVPKELETLQKELVERCQSFGHSYSDAHQDFEINFRPHLTIGRHLTKEGLTEALSEIGSDTYCTAIVDSFNLTVVENSTFEEWSDPKRKTTFILRNT